MSFEQNSVLENHKLSHRKLVFEFRITAHATPALKVHASDLPGICFIRTEGLTAVADAVESDPGFTTANDEGSGNSVFGILLKGSELGSIKKVLKVSISESTDTLVAASLAATLIATNGLTTGGNIAIDIAGTGLRLDTESVKLVCEVDYMLAE